MYIDFLIAAYNCEKYLEKCVTSISNFNTNEYNIIIYNDGSTDNTLVIATELMKKYKNIKIINSKKNQGVVHARFELIKSSTSEYIFFVDADDYILNVSQIFEKLKNVNYDIIQFNRKKIDSRKQLKNLDRQKKQFAVSINKFDFLGMWGKENNITYSIHNKLIRRSLFNNFSFEENIYPQIFEDLLMNIYLISQNPSILISNEYTYVYRTQINSLTSDPIKIIYSSKKMIELISNQFKEIISEKLLFNLQRNVFEYYILNKIKDQCIQKCQAEKCYNELFSILYNYRSFFL